MQWISYILFMLLGWFLQMSNITLVTWQFWAILVTVMAIGVVGEIRGCHDATGRYPWVKE